MSYVRSRALGDAAATLPASSGPATPSAALVQLAALPEDQWRARMLQSQEAYQTAYAAWMVQDQRARYLQIAATLAIPLAAAVWKWILGRRNAV